MNIFSWMIVDSVKSSEGSKLRVSVITTNAVRLG